MKKFYIFFVAALLINLNGFAQNCLTFSFNGTAPVAPTTTTAGVGGTGAIQTYTVPAGVTAIRIDAGGAKGGRTPDFTGGNGRRVTATFAVTAGEVLHILVGGKGGDGAADNGVQRRSAAGGGGGTFISKGAIGTGSLLLVAGGGGGAGDQGNGGISNDTPGSGSSTIGAGGGSFSVDGSNSVLDNDCGKGGKAATNGGNGGANTCFKPETNGGGYGGGGAGNYEVGRNNAGGGGGGGYIGGNSGGVAGGNGGSSYTDSTATNVVRNINLQDNGWVTIVVVGGTHSITWTGAVNTDWNNPCNWSPNGVPTVTNQVVINNVTNAPVVLSGTTAVAKEIYINAAASLKVNSGGILNVNVTTVPSSINLQGANSSLINQGTINVGTGNGNGLNGIAVSRITNSGIINNASAIMVSSGEMTFINEPTGVVNGIFRSGNGDLKLTNRGRINLVGDGNTAINFNNSSTLVNEGIIRISSGGGISNPSGSTITNEVCGKIFLNVGSYINGGTTNNAGLIVTPSFNNTNGTFNNTGIVNLLPTTGTVTNTGNNAVHVRSLTAPIFNYGGTFNGTINGIFTDSLATISAGTFTAPNTFVPLATLPRGVQTLYAKITTSGGSCVHVVPFSYNTLTSSVSKIPAQTIDLQQNRPNPFHQETMISFVLTESQKATLTIYDLNGRVVFTVQKVFNAGNNDVKLDKSVFPTTGTYFYRLAADNYAIVKKLQFVAE